VIFLDARKAGFETYVVENACCGIDPQVSLTSARSPRLAHQDLGQYGQGRR
jgi:nicotinamidase-related amidase